jgi:type II secretory pathway pseudopilin PulG/uncharacterized protein (DUF2141 family)
MDRPTTPPVHRERAFGLVEAIVAAFIVLIVGVAVSTILVSTSKTQAAASLSERRLATAEGLFERLKADNAWAGPSGAGCNTMPLSGANSLEQPCSSTWLATRYANDVLVDQSGAEAPVRFEARFDVVGVDDQLDGTGGADVDGMRPDYYRATIGVRRAGSTDARWTELSGTIDPPGRVSTGALSINVCRVERQWDERIPIASCPEPHEVLLGYPAGGLAAALGGSADPHAGADWQAALDRAGPGGGPLGWAMVTYDVRPADGVTIELRRKDGGAVRTTGFVTPSGCSSPTETVLSCTSNSGTPIRRVIGLTAGQYDVTVAGVPAGYEHWPLHSIPAGNTAIVEAGRTSRVLQVIKPTEVDSYTVSLRSCDNTETPRLSGGPCVDALRYGISGQLAPASSARAHWSFDGMVFGSGVQSAGAGASEITFHNLAPGLYSARIVTPSQGSLSLRHRVTGADLPYMWLNPPADGLWTGHVPPSGDARYTQHWCDYDRRVAYLASRGLGPEGGTRTYTGTRTDPTTGELESYTYDVTYTSADPCRGSSGGPGPPGPGGGGA